MNLPRTILFQILINVCFKQIIKSCLNKISFSLCLLRGREFSCRLRRVRWLNLEKDPFVCITFINGKYLARACQARVLCVRLRIKLRQQECVTRRSFKRHNTKTNKRNYFKHFSSQSEHRGAIIVSEASVESILDVSSSISHLVVLDLILMQIFTQLASFAAINKFPTKTIFSSLAESHDIIKRSSKRNFVENLSFIFFRSSLERFPRWLKVICLLSCLSLCVVQLIIAPRMFATAKPSTNKLHLV